MKTVAALLISLFSLVFFYFIFYKAYQIAFGKKFLKQLFTKKFTIAFSIIAFIGLLLVIFSISKNNFVYYWDFGGYWTSSYTYNNALFEDPFHAIGSLGSSIWNSDYNLVLPLIISLPFKILGFSFMRYIIINYLMFFIPAAIVAISIYVKLRNNSKKKASRALPLFAIATFVYPFLPMLKGYIDIALLIPMLLLFALAIDFNALKPLRENKGRNIIIGILLVVTFIFRRYSAFFLIGYITSLVLYSIYSLYKARKKKNFKELLKNAFFNYLSIGLVALAIMLIFFAPLVFRILGNNYSDMYAGYDLPLGEKLYWLVKRVGIIVCALSIVGIIGSIITKKHTKITAIATISLIIATITFFRVQNMDTHHVYIITSQFAILSFIGLSFILEQRVTILKVFTVFALLLQPATFFFGTAQRITKPVNMLFTESRQPFIRNDMTELQRLVNDLNDTKSSNIYVLASSGTFNSDVINSFNKPYSNHAVPALATTHDVDLRDGFPEPFLTAQYVVDATPIQLYLAKGTQEVVRYPSDLIKDPSSYIGDNFKKLDNVYYLDNNIVVTLYQKTSDFSNEDYRKMIDYYDSYYPNRSELFGDRIKKYITE